jgi:hypothetical protein
MQPSILTEEQYKEISRNLVRSVESRHRIVPLNSLKKYGYKLNEPIYISLESDGDSVIASLDDIEAFAYADTEYEAINALCDEITTIFEDLRTDRENLGVLPKKWLAYLEEIIIVHENS